MMELGIDSLKLRDKSICIATVVSVYRKVIDAYARDALKNKNGMVNGIK